MQIYRTTSTWLNWFHLTDVTRMRSGFFRHFRDIWEQYEDKEACIYTDQGTLWPDSARLEMFIKNMLGQYFLWSSKCCISKEKLIQCRFWRSKNLESLLSVSGDGVPVVVPILPPRRPGLIKHWSAQCGEQMGILIILGRLSSIWSTSSS